MSFLYIKMNENIYSNHKDIYFTIRIEKKPLLKGYFHLISLILFSSIFIFTYDESFTFDIYLGTVILHFLTSTLLHIYPWDKYLSIIRKIDHIVIYFVIWMAYQTFINTIIPEFSLISHIILNTGTILGIISRIIYTDARPDIIAIPYIIVGWCALTDINSIFLMYSRSSECFMCIIVSGLCFTTGAIFYIKRPTILYINKYIGFHEIFHFFTIMGVFFFTYAVYYYAMPFSTKKDIYFFQYR